METLNYWKSAHPHFSLNCCWHCVQPDSIPLQSILYKKFGFDNQKFSCIPFYYWKSAQLRVSLSCCQHSVKPGSIACQSILNRIQIQHRKYCRKRLIATIYWRQEISYYSWTILLIFIFTLLLPLMLLSRQHLVLECFTFGSLIWNPKIPKTSVRNWIWCKETYSVVHKLLILSIDLIPIPSDFQNYWLPDDD